MQDSQPEYVGFWARVGAALIDAILMALVFVPVVWLLGGHAWSGFDSPMNIFMRGILPGVVVVLFWVTRQATPGKMLIGAKIADAKTLGVPSAGQFIGRYLCYYLSSLLFGLGFIWAGFDPRKQGWHDKLAGTVVIRAR